MLQRSHWPYFSRTLPLACESWILPLKCPEWVGQGPVLPLVPMECLEQIVKVYLGSRKSWFKHSSRDHSDVIYKPSFQAESEGMDLLPSPVSPALWLPLSLPFCLSTTQEHPGISDVSLPAGSPESVFSGHREVLGRGAKGSPLLTKGQERFLVMGLVGQGGTVRSHWVDRHGPAP